MTSLFKTREAMKGAGTMSLRRVLGAAAPNVSPKKKGEASLLPIIIYHLSIPHAAASALILRSFITAS